MSAQNTEAHHAAPRCLLRLHERANDAALGGEGIEAWLEWEWEAAHWRVPVEIPKDELEELVREAAQVRFPLGRVVVTPGALEAFGREGGFLLLYRHAGGDWGDVDGADRRENERPA